MLRKCFVFKKLSCFRRMFELDFGDGEKRMCLSGIAVIETVNWLIFEKV